jgi:hypothetical protein
MLLSSVLRGSAAVVFSAKYVFRDRSGHTHYLINFSLLFV